jgi:hypothetical protein
MLHGSDVRRRWIPILDAIAHVARQGGLRAEEAWDAVKADIGRGELPARGRDDQGEFLDFERHWISFLAKFGAADPQPKTPTEPGTPAVPIKGNREAPRLTDFPTGGVVWFDRRRAAENRVARARTADNRKERSLPPTRVRDLVADAVRLEELYPLLPMPDTTATASPTPESSVQAVEPEPPSPEPRKRRRGPAPGKLDRYGESDRALFDELKQMMRDQMMSSTAAANILADQGRVAGIGAKKSRAKRLAERYRSERRN